jgi:putative membrane protein
MGWVVYERRMGYPDRRSFLLAALITVAVNTAAIFLAAEIVPGVTVGDFWSGLVAGMILGIVNAVVRPILTCLTCAITVLTLGLFLLVINMAMLALTAWLVGILGLEFDIDDFWAAWFASIIVTMVTLVASAFLPSTRRLRWGRVGSLDQPD